MESETNKDTGAQQPTNAPRTPQRPYEHGDSGSGTTKETDGGPGTAGSVPPAKPGDIGGQ